MFMLLKMSATSVLGATIAMLALGGCTIGKYQTINSDADALAANYEKIIEQFNPSPDFDLPASEHLKISRKDAWLFREIEHDYSHLGFRKVLASLFPGVPIIYDNQIPMDYDPTVVAPPSARLIKEHLDAIALQTNLGWSLKNGVVLISPNQVRNYSIPVFGSFGGRGGQGVRQDIGVKTNNLGVAREKAAGEFQNEVSGTISVYDEIASLVVSTTNARPCNAQGAQADGIDRFDDPVKAPLPCFSLSGASNTLMLSARPRAHSLFLSAYEPWVESANLQVQVTLKMLVMDVTDLAQQSLDLSLVRSAAIAGANTIDGLGISGGSASQNFVNFDESANGLTFSFSDKYAGSNFILRALNQIGKTYMTEINEFVVRNNQLHSVFFEEETPFLESVSVQTTNTSATSSSTTPTLKSNVTRTGSALNVLTTVSGGEISLRLDIDEKSLGVCEDYDLSTPDTTVRGSRCGSSSSSFTINQIISDGDTVMAVSSARQTFDVKNAKNDLMPIVGDARSARGRKFTNIYLIGVDIIK